MPVSRKPAENKTEPYWRSECGRAVVYVGDNVEVMVQMAEQFHAVVTDPPYGLEFMGKEWDAPWKNNGAVIKDPATERGGFQDGNGGNPYSRSRIEYGRGEQSSVLFQQWFLARAVEILRVAKPGAHLLSFGGTRMWHRMACAVEDAGWEIRDTIMWVYGSGFPKGQNVSLAIDKTLGAEREAVGRRLGSPNTGLCGGDGYSGYAKEGDSFTVYGGPITDAAKQWDGWNTALKPSVEPIVMARKPFTKSVAQCVLDNNTGALNIDGCRVGTTGEDITRQIQSKSSSGSGVYQFNSGEAGSQSMQGGFAKTHKDGRWPANLIHDGSDEVVELFPEQAGGGTPKGGGNAIGDVYGQGWTIGRSSVGHNDCGSAARFFYTAKANDDDRPHGKEAATVHPTVKPLDLMRYLVRLVCARGGTVLDPFMGSGSTGCAAVAEGMRFVGIEQSQEYADIAVGRLRLALASAPPMTELVTHGASGCATTKDTAPTPRRLR